MQSEICLEIEKEKKNLSGSVRELKSICSTKAVIPDSRQKPNKHC